MTEAASEFDRCAIPICPSQLTAPVLHKVMNWESLKPHMFGCKGKRNLSMLNFFFVYLKLYTISLCFFYCFEVWVLEVPIKLCFLIFSLKGKVFPPFFGIAF